MEAQTPSRGNDLISRAARLVSEQAACTDERALDRMREAADSEGETIENIARGVVEGTILFSS